MAPSLVYICEGCREGRKYSKVTYPESYVTMYTSIRRTNSLMVMPDKLTCPANFTCAASPHLQGPPFFLEVLPTVRTMLVYYQVIEEMPLTSAEWVSSQPDARERKREKSLHSRFALHSPI